MQTVTLELLSGTVTKSSFTDSSNKYMHSSPSITSSCNELTENVWMLSFGWKFRVDGSVGKLVLTSFVSAKCKYMSKYYAHNNR